MLIAVPSEQPGGLEAPISEHFGHCHAFTLVRVDDGAIGEVSVLANSAHQQGGCMAPVQLLKSNGVDVLVAGGMGARPLAGFQQVGIAVHFKEQASRVAEAVELFLAGGCREFGDAQTCGGGSGQGCGGHDHHDHHAPVEREPIVGTADVRDGRVVSFDFELRDGDGRLLESSSATRPMRYLHGSGQVLPALERGLAGLEPGQEAEIAIARADAFGERDPSRRTEVARADLPPGVAVGSVVTAQDGEGRRFQLVVEELGEETAVLDSNHPLAGKDLVFKVQIRSVESATPDEIEHGHLH
ncbi:MAG: NifB/NifX family molybdenum-iron cluster-binding protein [Candidatus Krumholzibacteriia bacterium]